MPTPPPLTLTPRIITLSAEIGEFVGGWKALGALSFSPQLRRENRIRTIQASLAIENNSLGVDQTTDQASDQVKLLLKTFGGDSELSAEEILSRLGLRHKPTFRKNYLNPALAAGWIEMTEPSSPRSPTQRYRLTKLAPLSHPSSAAPP